MGGEGTEGAVVAPCCQPVTSPAKSCEHISGLYHSLANRCMALDEAGSVVSLLIASLSRHRGIEAGALGMWLLAPESVISDLDRSLLMHLVHLGLELCLLCLT